MNASDSASAEAPHGHQHRKLITRALVGPYASLEHRTDPSLPEDRVEMRAMQHAAHAYDRLAGSRVGQLVPNKFGKAVLVTVPHGRMDA